MNKRAKTAIVSIIIVALIVVLGSEYYRFVSKTIYSESVSHLTEVFHQASVSLHSMIANNYGDIHLWSDYLQYEDDEKRIEKHFEKAREDSGFTDLYFISRNGKYISLSGEKGNMDFKTEMYDLILEKKDIAIRLAIPGHPQVIVFATPAKKNTYKGFEYEAIGVGYSNKALLEELKISAFNGEASSFVVHSDGRVVVDNAQEKSGSVYNFISTLSKHSDLSGNELDDLCADLKNSSSGSGLITLSDIKCYIIYEPVGIDDWSIISVVPSGTVNSSMNRLQSLTMAVMTVIMMIIAGIVLTYIIRRNRLILKEKDIEILYRDEMFDKVSINVDDVFLMLDSYNLRVDYVSPNIEKLMGISQDQARQSIHEIDGLIENPDTVLIWDQLPDILPDEQREWDRQYVHKKTGEVRWFHVVAFCSEMMDEKKYILVMSDRTKDKHIKEELESAVSVAEDALKMAEAASKAKSTFLSNMSHDIRTPMNAVIGFTTLGLANVDDREKVQDYLSKILSSSNHLLSLINDILDMSRIESGKIVLEETEANLSDMLHDIKTIVGGQISSKQLELFMDVIDVTNEDVYCDRTRLNQVLLNLISNAIKFTPAGGIISVRIAQIHNSAEGMGSYEIRVKDTGIGMSPEFAKKIFEPFERERNSTVSKIQGTGLGMAISKNIIDMMGGTIDVITEPDKGTEFIVRLSLRIRPESTQAVQIKELEGFKALVVDDDFNTCDSVTKMLIRVGMRSEWTLSGKEAVLRAKQALELDDRYHAYIIDWRLPDMNGIEVTRRIRSLDDNTPIIILTAYDWDDIAEEAKEAGVTAFCSKPMFMSDLREALLTAIGQKPEQDEGNHLNIDENNGFEGKRILLVEDNELNKEIAEEILSKHGFVVETANDGSRALDMVKASEAGHYDLILMDIQMPVMNGYEATRRIRAIENPKLASVPILAMTANVFNEDRKVAAECGMDGFLSKPIDIAEVVRELQKVFEKKGTEMIAGIELTERKNKIED
ncbi:MAG: response regulator [Firmicutes bacterium]|nr:response regulator [Bacillota bacterium]